MNETKHAQLDLRHGLPLSFGGGGLVGIGTRVLRRGARLVRPVRIRPGSPNPTAVVTTRAHKPCAPTPVMAVRGGV
jgi:hypothetical protein